MISDLVRILRLSRLFDAAYPIVSLLLGAAIVGQVDEPKLGVLVIVVLIFNSVAMIWNDIEDRQVDADNRRPELAKTSAASILRLKTQVVALTGIGLIVAWFAGVEAFLLAVITICVIWTYNSRPFQASRRPILSLVVLSGAGALLPFFFGLSLGTVELSMVVAGIFWWIGRGSLSILKDYKDAKGDALHGKKTFLLRYGARRTAIVSILALMTGYGGLIAAFHTTGGSPWSLLFLAIAIGLFVHMRRPLLDPKGTYDRFDQTFRTIAQYQLLLDTGIVLWLI